jgi:hypothetical protein
VLLIVSLMVVIFVSAYDLGKHNKALLLPWFVGILTIIPKSDSSQRLIMLLPSRLSSGKY